MILMMDPPDDVDGGKRSSRALTVKIIERCRCRKKSAESHYFMTRSLWLNRWRAQARLLKMHQYFPPTKETTT
jgi:hypothetical protein